MVEIDEFLSSERMVLGLRSGNKRQLFQELATIAAEATGLDAATILAALNQREKLGTTGIGAGIAIPHARLKQLASMTGFFARMATPVEYDRARRRAGRPGFPAAGARGGQHGPAEGIGPDRASAPRSGSLRPAAPRAGSTDGLRSARRQGARRRCLTEPAGGRTGAALRSHGCAAAWCGRGVLLRGESGSGKSALLARLLAAGAYLIADDLVELTQRERGLHVAGPAPAGLIELRGNGIFRVATTVGVPVSLCVELASSSDGERLPESSTIALLGIEVPLLRLDGRAEAAVAQILLALAARRAH